MSISYRSNIPYAKSAPKLEPEVVKRDKPDMRGIAPRKPWTTDHVEIMLKMHSEGYWASDIARALDRTQPSVVGKAHLLGLRFSDIARCG